MNENLQLAGGETVPRYLVKALEDLEKVWPGASLRQARPAVVAAILKAQKQRSKAKLLESTLMFYDVDGVRHAIGKVYFDKTTGEATMEIDSPRFFILVAENTSAVDNEETPE